nr:ankyrin repeat domain-containing protein 26-like [Microcebus murinus]XP_012612226.1 ankyrin repeat domain-containing protein 26-like [Microcebus murinus]XP_012612227.1 ankyrin repeat domain-containing protein 26-like [Microcebus murinus]XP_012612228.1 ankyrin repeat domain-containing protein 26-like [Microcebus murinus]XP_012612229.1 ankyrin repeat domain-containing protein 26-like [Microcebus murinus]XP_020137479.1 ankyrin repeat domain-containing protein 26-like [Microcebus murinus]XP_02
MKQQLEQTMRTQDVELKSLKNNLNEISHIHGQEKELLHENRMLQNTITRLSMEIDMLKIENQEKQDKYLKDIAVLKEKTDDLQKTVQVNQARLTKMMSQYNEQLNLLTAENTMLNSQLQNEKRNKERLEAEVGSCFPNLAATRSVHDQTQASKRHEELDFQKAREKWPGAEESLSSYVNILFQKLSEAEMKFCSLEIKFYNTKNALKQKTLDLEKVQRELSETQCQKKEIELMYKNEQHKVNDYTVEKESLEERLSLLERKNLFLQQQLEHAQNTANKKEKTITDIQTQFLDIVKELQADSEQKILLLEERNKDLSNECNHLKERQYQYDKEEAERGVAARQLQKQLAGTLQKLSRAETSLGITACHTFL